MEPKHTTFSEENRRKCMIDTVSDEERLPLYCEALLADLRITTLHNPATQHPVEVTQIYVPQHLLQERQLKYDLPLSEEESSNNSENEADFWIEEERQHGERH